MNQFIDYIGLFVFLYPAIMAVYWGSTGLMYFLKQEKLSRNKKFADYPNYKYHTDAPLVSLLVPCYNEADNIDESLPFLLKSNYPNLEIILVNDGSKDDTAQYIKRWSQAHKNIYAYYQKNSGKATALNQVLKYARGKHVVCIDGDSSLDMDAIDFMVYALENNPGFVAVTGNPRVRNRSTLLGRLQVAEFSSIIGLIKRSQSILGSIFTVSGVVCAFRRDALLQIGGWSKDMITEDIDISWKLQVEGNRIGYEPRALCWVLMPETIHGLYKQRLRWAQGGAEVVALALVVDHVRGPQHVHFMPQPVRPVVTEVVKKQRQHPEPPSVGGPFGGTKGLKHHHVDAKLGKHTQHLAQHTVVQTGYRIGDVVHRQTLAPSPPGLEHDGEHEHGNGINNGIHGEQRRLE